MIRAIATREFRSLVVSPLAWLVLAVVQFILAYVFLASLDVFIEAQPRLAGLENAPGITEIVIMPLFGSMAVVLLLIVPIITMRTFSDERRNGTWTLLVTAPVTVTEIVIGKFCGVLGFFFILIALLILMPVSLLVAGSVDLGHLGASTLAITLLTASFTAIGLFASSLYAHPAAAAISSFGVLLMLWIVDWRAGAASGDIMSYISMLRHYHVLLAGQVSSVDIVYFLLVIALALSLSIWRLDAEKWWSAR